MRAVRHLELIAALHATALELGELRKRRPLRRYRDVALGPHGGLLQERLFGGFGARENSTYQEFL